MVAVTLGFLVFILTDAVNVSCFDVSFALPRSFRFPAESADVLCGEDVGGSVRMMGFSRSDPDSPEETHPAAPMPRSPARQATKSFMLQ
jgi:hypothetical protein